MAKLTFAKKEKTDSNINHRNNPWIIIVADDDGDVHAVTKMVLKNFRFENRPIRIISSYNGSETLSLLEKHPDTAVLLLDVVMESYTAGLDVTKDIRNTLKNNEVRIVLRSGQAGYANTSDIIQQFDINDFVRKENLKHQDLVDTILIALRSYRDIILAKEQHNI